MRHWTVRSLPNLASSLNLFFGSAAIASLFLGYDNMVISFLVFCYFLDTLDGILARTLDSRSLFGREIDSLADLVSFGLLPASMVFRWIYVECRLTEEFVFALLAYLIAVGAGIRLAKFNLDMRQSRYFLGLPTPAATFFIAGVFYMDYAGHPLTAHFLCEPVFFIALIVLLPILLVSDLQLWSLKAVRHRNGTWILVGFLLLFLILILWIKSAAFPVIVICYLLFGVLNLFLKIYGDEV